MRLYQVDAFTNQRFKGNPAGVCILPADKMKDDQLLQNIAAEMNVSETAFISKKGNEYHLRWFSPETEVEFCGHATLSTAHILWETGLEKKEELIQFSTLSGRLFARYKTGKVELDFPTFDVKEVPEQPDINAALCIQPVYTGITKNRYLIEIEGLQVLKQMKPDFVKLKDIGQTAFIVTCKSEDRDFDFYSRFFCPAIGINEDPVTGSSHSSLAPYWAKKLGKSKMLAYQASKRGGTLECELSANNRVFIRGQAVTVFEIEMKEDR
jgi:PhzF family phenazine biosynthesis protein